MSGPVVCFWLEPTLEAEVRLRRFVWSDTVVLDDDGGMAPIDAAKCPGPMGYHDADKVLGLRIPYTKGVADPYPRGPEWPTRCDGCAYEFKDSDEWQTNHDQLYRRSDNDELVSLHSAPAGAMWDAEWYGDHCRGPDGIHLVVRTPAGDWLVDGKASNGPGWKRTGKPPKITATPSIGMGKAGGGWRYHGWLRNGVLVPC